MKKTHIFLLLSTASLAARAPDAGMNLLEQSSKAFTQIAREATPATVYIKCQISPPSAQDQELGQQNPFGGFHDEFFRHFFGGTPHFQQQQPQMTSGSGFVIVPTAISSPISTW
jgi:hypothetical protein